MRETAWWSGMRMRVLSQRFDERWRKLSPLARAVVVDSLVVILALITTLSGDNPEGNQNWAVIAALTLAVRRPLPELALLATVAIDGYSGTDVFPALGLAAFAVGRRSQALPGLLTIVLALGIFAVAPGDQVDRLGKPGEVAMFILLPLMIGLYVRRGYQLLTAHQQRAEVLQPHHEIAAERAVLRERTRIAEEIHDALGHRLSLVVLHAGALELAGGKEAERAELIRVAGKDALHDLRRVIGLLRHGDTAAADATTALDAVEDLVIASQRAGVPVKASLDTPLDDLDPRLAQLVHGVLREALTNVHKHAGQVDTQIQVYLDEHGLCVEVHNAPPTEPPVTKGLGSGSGLIALAERVGLVGGRLEHGPTPSGGFQVRACFPVAAT